MDRSEQSKPASSTYQSLQWEKKTLEWPDAWPSAWSGEVPSQASKSDSLSQAIEHMNRKQIER